MSSKIKLFPTLALSAVIGVFGISAFAQDAAQPTKGAAGNEKHDRRDGSRGKRGPMGMFRGIDLSEAQKTQIKAIMEANRSAAGNRDELKAIMTAKRNGTITPEQEAKAKSFREARVAKAQEMHKQIMAVLTPEQLQKMEAHKQEMKGRMKDRMKGRRGEGFRNRGFDKGGKFGMLRGIDLSEAQKSQIKAITEANRPTDGNRDELKAIMTAKRNGTITPEQEAKAKSFREARVAKAQEMHKQIMAVLTPEQLKKMEARKQEMKTRMDKRREGRDRTKTSKETPTDK